MKKTKSISRRRFLSGAAASCLAGSAMSLLGGEPAEAQWTRIASSKVDPSSPLMVEGHGYRLTLNPRTGSLASFRATYGVDRELLAANHSGHPLLRIQLMDNQRKFQRVFSSDAREIHVHRNEGPKETILTMEFLGIGGLQLDARVTARCPRDESLTYWSLELNNNTGLWIANVQFPVVQVPFDDVARGDHSQILSGSTDGILAGPVTSALTAGQWGSSPRNTPEAWRQNNYPGQWWSAQLMAYYNDAGGLYIACDDAKGLPKLLGPLLDDDGVTMALGHYPGTCTPGAQPLPYNVVLGTFQGDWYRAAEIYREWAGKQPFCARKLAERTDVPKWIADSPVAIAFPLRGQGDWDGPAKENQEYTHADKAISCLDTIAAKINSPLLPILFNWEHAGPWVQPEAFPPVGGEANMRDFITQTKQRGWHPMMYGDGLSWVTGQKNTGYDGMKYFREHHGESTVVQSWNGELKHFDLGNWRQGYVVCVGTKTGQEIVLNMTHNIAALQPSAIQQFDQGPGPVACYALDHGHPPVPGPWMTEKFQQLLKADKQAAWSADPGAALSCEGAPPETNIQNFQLWDSRASLCPLYSFLYHEYVNGFQGFYTNRVSDEALRLSVARALVAGYMLNFTLRNDGLIEYDWDQPWTRAVPDQQAIFDWAKRANHLRAAIARDYLLYGRMLRPYAVRNVTQRDLGWGMEPLVPSATWQAQDGRIAVVLANASDLGETPQVELQGRGTKQVTCYLDGETTTREMELPAVLELTMAPRTLCLIEIPA